MKNNIFMVLLFSAVILFAGIFSGCSSSIAIQNPVVGIVQMVGNDPFIKLAVNINNKDIYFLECTKELQAELIKNQNRVFEIVYSDVKKTSEGITLVVEKAVQIVVNVPKVAESYSPGTAGVICQIVSIEEKDNSYLCDVKIKQVIGYGSATKLISENNNLKIDFVKNLLNNKKPEAGQQIKLEIAQPMGGMNIPDTKIWTVIKILK